MNAPQHAAKPERHFTSHAEFYQDSAYSEFQQEHRTGGSFGITMMRVEQDPIDLIDAPVPEIAFCRADMDGREILLDIGDGTVFNPHKRRHLTVYPASTAGRTRVSNSHSITLLTLPVGDIADYQDAGSWTLMESTPVDRAKAAWLYAQFVTSKTVDLKKSDVGLTFIRESTIDSDHFTERAPFLGGLVEFYRSPARVAWSPTGTNVPDYPRLAQLWWQNIGDAMSGQKTAQEALDALCEAQEAVLERLERAGVQGDIGPAMNEERDAEYWFAQPGAPYPPVENEDEQPITVSYDELIQSWQH